MLKRSCFNIYHQSHLSIGSEASSIMAEVRGPKIPGENVRVTKSRSPEDRRGEIGERKLQCPFCRRKNITYRKIVKDHSEEGKSSNCRVGIRCSEPDCMYVCTVGILCWYRHLKAFHDGRKDTPYSAVAVDILADESIIILSQS